VALQVAAAKSFSIASDHLEQFSRGVSALTVDPYKNAIYYFFPFIGAFFNGYHQLRNDPSQEAMMPSAETDLILKEIEILTNCADIKREVIPYIALNHVFASFGGSFSITKPALCIPVQHLFRHNKASPFPQEQPEELLRQNAWIYSDNETRFMIARELGQIKDNSVILKVAIKVAVLAALFMIYATPFAWTAGIGLCIGAIGLYICSERFFQAKADITGTEILGKRIPNSVPIAIATLEKIRQQNLTRRENSALARLYITPSGNNLLDFVHPFLTTRIECLRQLEGNI
jgi:hypothetical protein